MTTIRFTEMGTKPITDCAAWHIASIANDRERRLLNLHCGQMLPKARHNAWAAEKVAKAKIETVPTKLPFAEYQVTF